MKEGKDEVILVQMLKNLQLSAWTLLEHHWPDSSELYILIPTFPWLSLLAFATSIP